MESRNSATWSTRRWPSLRNVALSISSGACRGSSLSMSRSLFDILALPANSFQEVRFQRASTIYRPEGPIKGLPSPQRLVILWRQVLQRLIGGNLRFVTGDCFPHRGPYVPCIDHGRDLPVGPRHRLPLHTVDR